MASKRNTKAVKRGKKVKNLAVKSTQAKGVRGGTGWIEEFQWGVGRGLSNPTGGEGAGAGKSSISDIKLKKP